MSAIRGSTQIKENSINITKLINPFISKETGNWVLSDGIATVTNIPDPINPLDIVNKKYVDDKTNQIQNTNFEKVIFTITSDNAHSVRIAQGTGQVSGMFKVIWSSNSESGTVYFYVSCYQASEESFTLLVLDYQGRGNFSKINVLKDSPTDPVYLEIVTDKTQTPVSISYEVTLFTANIGGWKLIDSQIDPGIPTNYSENSHNVVQDFLNGNATNYSADGSTGVSDTITVTDISTFTQYTLTIKDGIIVDIQNNPYGF